MGAENHPRTWARRLRGQEASQLVEFAVALPLLVVFVVGIFDFGNAFNLKQKLNTAVREGARRGSNLPTGDLANGGTPGTVTAVRDVVAGYLQAARINDCGLSSAGASPGSSPLSWRYTAAANGCPGTLTLTIERGYSYPALIESYTFNVISTRVSISYPYQWRFNSVITLLVPGPTATGPTLISTDAVAPNMD